MNTKEKSVAIIQYFNIFCSFFGGFTINMATYFSWLIIPLLMKEHGGTSFQIGLADAITFGICGLICPVVGTLLNKPWFPMDDVCRVGFVFQALSTFVIGIYYTTGTELLPIFFILLFQSFGLSSYWSIAEYMISNEAYKHESNKVVSLYSMWWSLGKAIGFLLGGPMRLAFGNTYSLFFAGIIVMFGWLLFPRFPRNRTLQTRLETKMKVQMANGEVSEQTMMEEIAKEKKMMKESKKKSVQKFPYHYMMYYFNTLVIHFTVYGTIAVFGNQYIDFADEEHITLQGINDDPGTFCSVFLGVIYFSQTVAFFIYGRFHQWQYKPWLNVLVQAAILAVSIVMVYVRNGWVLVCCAIPVGFIAGYDMQASVIYAVNAGPEIKGKILGLSECVGELTCALCPLVAGLLATSFNDRRFALYQGMVLQVVGMILCLALYIAVIVQEKRSGKIYREDENIDEEEEAELSEESSESSEEVAREKKKDDVDIPDKLIKRKEVSDSSSVSSTSSEDDAKKQDANETPQQEKKDDVEIPQKLLKKKDTSESSTVSSTSDEE